MTAPRLEIDLEKIRQNASFLAGRLKARGISVTAITKSVLGDPQIAAVLLQAGISTLGDSRINNIESMRGANIPAPMTLIRSPMLSQVDRVVASADISFNTELDIIRALSASATGMQRCHGIVLMVELGDLREGIMPADLETGVREVLRLPGINLVGIGANLACRSGVAPDTANMDRLSSLADSIDASFGPVVTIVSGGNSASLEWALGSADIGRVNNLRLGESILLGVEPLHRQPISGLHLDAIRLVAEVIESKTKPSQPWGEIAQAAFGTSRHSQDRGLISQTILAVGQQDTDTCGLCAPEGVTILGASSDHLVLDTGNCIVKAGSEMSFGLNYSALLRAMTSPFVATVFRGSRDDQHLPPDVLVTRPNPHAGRLSSGGIPNA
jgi:predicted amino acid racemase